ncbi:AsmA family protein [Rhizobium sp. AAP43]|uniref:AsmA family protein n=1 Tax=Rhizobium sp. AAP43 TaxID=1523420 RepID=UPI0006B8986A|nr:AsmA family protein [Rhizobium sp. AAP43]KPF42385.1 hypothetical protein IP76_17205 [Rhizobium sp. AAP43]
MLGRILVTLGGLLVIALFVALFAPFFVDWTSFRQEFEDRSSQILGKKVTVHGAVSARLLPFPSLTMEDVTVGTDVDGSPLVHVARFSLDAELAPLLSGEVRIFDMRIDEPKARIRLLQDGTLDWLRGSKPSMPARIVVLEKVTVTGGQIEFIDQQTGRNRLITGLDANVSARSLAGPWAIDGRAVLDGEASHFTLNTAEIASDALPLRLRLEPDARPFSVQVDGSLALREERPVYQGRFDAQLRTSVGETAEKGDPQVPEPRIRGDVELTNESISIASYRMEIGDTKDPYVITGEAKLDTGAKPEFRLVAEGQQVDVAKLAAEGTRAKTSRVGTMSLQRRLDILLKTAAEIPIPKVPGQARLRLPAIVAGDSVFRDIQLDVRPDGQGWTVENAVAVLPGRTQVEAKGRLMLAGSPSFEGDLLIASTQPSGLATWLSGQVDPAIRQLKSAGLSAKVNLTPELQRFENLELAVGADPLKGRLERESPKNGESSLSLDLAGKMLDLDAARAIAALVTGQDDAEQILAKKVAARLEIDQMVALGVTAGKVDAILRYTGGRLDVERLNIGNVEGAALRVTGMLEGSRAQPKGKARATFTATDPSRFIELVKQRFPETTVLGRLSAAAPFYADTDVTFDVVVDEASSLTVTGNGRANASQVSLRYSNSNFRQPDAAERVLDVSLQNDDGLILLGQMGLDPLPYPIGDGGTLTLKVDSTDPKLAAVTLSYAGRETRVALNGEAAGFDGALPTSGNWTIGVDSTDFAPYLMALKSNLPALEVGLPVKGNVALRFDAGKIVLDDFTATIADQPVKGKLQVDLTQPRPMLIGTLAADQIDLDWLAETIIGPLRDPQTGALSGAPLGRSLPPVDVAVELTAGRLWIGMLEAVANFSGSLSLKSGELVLQAAKGEWLGGAVAGRVALSNADGAGLMQMRLDVKGADVARTIDSLRTERGLERSSALVGRADLTFNAEGAGASASELIGAANGSGQLQFPRLELSGVNFAIMPEIIKQADALGTKIDQTAVQGLVEASATQGGSNLDGLQLSVALSDRVLRVQNASFETEAAKLAGDLRIDLSTGEVEAALRAALAAGDAAMEGAEPALRLFVTGQAVNPAVGFDVTELTNFLSLRAFEAERRRVEALQSSVLEKQRLRREAALTRSRVEERARLDAERAKREEEAKAAAEKQAAEEAAAAQQQQANQGQAQPAPPAAEPTTQSVIPAPALPTPPAERVVRQPLPDVRFEGLPGVN